MNKCLSKFYVSVRRKDGSYYKRNSLLSVRAALIAALQPKNFHLRGVSIITWVIILKQLFHSGSWTLIFSNIPPYFSVGKLGFLISAYGKSIFCFLFFWKQIFRIFLRDISDLWFLEKKAYFGRKISKFLCFWIYVSNFRISEFVVVQLQFRFQNVGFPK